MKIDSKSKLINEETMYYFLNYFKGEYTLRKSKEINFSIYIFLKYDIFKIFS